MSDKRIEYIVCNRKMTQYPIFYMFHPSYLSVTPCIQYIYMYFCTSAGIFLFATTRRDGLRHCDLCSCRIGWQHIVYAVKSFSLFIL